LAYLDSVSAENAPQSNWDIILVHFLLYTSIDFSDDALQSASSSSSSKRSQPDSDFFLPSSARSGLSNILIVHVIAAVLTFITLVLCIIAHVRRPSHSVRFLLAIFIIQILNAILTLLSFLVDLLVFVPHFASGTWLVLAATICNGIATSILLLFTFADCSFTMLWTTDIDRS
jgi:heme A synthase